MREFQLRQKTYTFDSSGDINLGYDVVMWTPEGRQINVHGIVAEYNTLYSNITFKDHNVSTRQLLEDLKVGPHLLTLMHKE